MAKQHDTVHTAQASNKQPYTAPKATFVPLKLEERLLGCLKTDPRACANGPSGS